MIFHESSSIFLLVSIISAVVNIANGIDSPRDQHSRQDEKLSATTSPVSTTPSEKSEAEVLRTNTSEEGRKQTASDDRGEENYLSPLDVSLHQETKDIATKKLLSGKLEENTKNLFIASSSLVSTSPSEKSEAEVLRTNTSEEVHKQTESDIKGEESYLSPLDVNLHQETTDKAAEKFLSTKPEENTKNLFIASSSSDSTPRKSRRTYSQALMSKSPEQEEEHEHSENDNTKSSSHLDERLHEAMDEAIKELLAENILEASSSTDTESSHSPQPSAGPSSPAKRRTDKSNDECTPFEKDANVAAFSQTDSSWPNTESGKQSTVEGESEASARSQAIDSESVKTGEGKASVESESSAAESSTERISYALALLGPRTVVKERETLEKKSADDDDTYTGEFPTLAEAREKKAKVKNKVPEGGGVELLCPIQEEREAIQMHAASMNLKYNANRKQVVIVPRGSNRVNVFDEFRRLNIDLTSFGVRTSVCLPSGAVFLRFETEAGTRKLHNAVSSTGLFEMKSTKSSVCLVRIHGVPQKTTMAELYYDLYMKYDVIPQRIRFTRDERDRSGHDSLAIIEVSESLLQKMVDSPDIRIRWRPRTIDTTVRIFRCSNCHVLGHRSEFCRLPSRSPPTIYEPCVDCTYFNHCNEILRSNLRRDTDHKTDDNELCISKRNQMSRTRENHNGREVDLRPVLM